jgi:hypothetical protein
VEPHLTGGGRSGGAGGRAARRGRAVRTDIVNGVGGDQIVLDDPSGNPVELFQYRG